MNVLLTGGSGMVGTAITDHLDNSKYEFTILDPEKHPEYPTHTASVANYEAIRPAFDEKDAVIHLAVYPAGIKDEDWQQIVAVNIHGTYNVLKACCEADIQKVIFASTNHVVGMYEKDNEPQIYVPDSSIMVDHTDPARPDSYYGVSKLFGENLGRFYVEEKRAPKQFYAVRIGSLRTKEYDHPYGDAERAVENGEIERGSEEYEQLVGRMKAMWFSRHDCAQMIERMLTDQTVSFDIFYGLSGNSRRWHDIEHAKRRLGYEPQDNGEEWGAPPDTGSN